MYLFGAEKEIPVESKTYDRIASNEQTAILLYNDQEYKAGEFVAFRELDVEGNYTRHWAEAELTLVIENYPGLESGYCVLVFHVFAQTVKEERKTE